MQTNKRADKTENPAVANANRSKDADNGERLIGDNLSFEGIEAFNLLRTNLMFSFSDDKKCHIIGLSSPIPGTGKSIISVNLALSFSKLNKKILLIDGDLRLPTVAKKLGITSKPGLSNALVSSDDYAGYIQKYNENLDVFVAGDVPPKPSELLGSARMKNLLDILSTVYDYIIIDSSPVTVVPDTLAIGKFVDGIVLAVRREHDGKPAVTEALRQLNIAKIRILGIVFNDGKSENSEYKKYKSYGNKKYYSSYYK